MCDKALGQVGGQELAVSVGSAFGSKAHCLKINAVRLSFRGRPVQSCFVWVFETALDVLVYEIS